MNKLTFVVQNETHALNFRVIAESLIARGFSHPIDILYLDPVTGLKTSGALPSAYSRPVSLFRDEPFYLASVASRFFWLIRYKDCLRREVAGSRVIVVGNDGAIQKLMAQQVRKEKGHVLLLLDGFIEPWPIAWLERLPKIAKLVVQRFAEAVKLDPYVPSHVGHSAVDRLYVMETFVKNSLSAQGVRVPIEVVALPRLRKLVQEAKTISERERKKNNILYATSAYKWHSDLKGDANQKRDVLDLCAFARQNPDYDFRIRVHPRERVEEYMELVLPDNVRVSDSSTPLQYDLGWASLLVTAGSTVAYEAKLVGLPVLIYTANFAPPKPGHLLNADPHYVKSSHLNIISQMLQDFVPFEADIIVDEAINSICSEIESYFSDATMSV